MAIASSAPILIIKDPKTRDDRPDGYRFAACIDGSDQSNECLEFIRRVRGPGDKITIIICEQENIEANAVRETVMYELEERDMHLDATIVILESESGRRTADLIREYLMAETENYIDYMFIGN